MLQFLQVLWHIVNLRWQQPQFNSLLIMHEEHHITGHSRQMVFALVAHQPQNRVPHQRGKAPAVWNPLLPIAIAILLRPQHQPQAQSPQKERTNEIRA